MKNASLLAAVLALILCGCAATSLKETWKSPDYPGGPVQKLAVLAMADQELQRVAMENSCVNGMQSRGQAAMITHGLVKLEGIKTNKQAVAQQLLAAGADTILIIRIADRVTREQEVRVGAGRLSTTGDNFGTADWQDYYMGGPSSMDTSWGELHQEVYIDSSLYDLKTNKRLWFCITETVMKEGSDWMAEIKPGMKKVLGALRKDGMIR